MALMIDSVADFQTLLNRFDVKSDQWGVGGTKTIEQLYQEIRDHESILSINENQLIRDITVVNVYVMSEYNLTPFILMEKSQHLITGVSRVRDMPLAEKLKPGESWRDAVVRGVSEELGITSPNLEIIPESLAQEVRVIDSFSYPGLRARYTTYYVKVRLPDLLPPDEFTTSEVKFNPLTQELGYQTTTWHWLGEMAEGLLNHDGTFNQHYAKYLCLLQSI